MALFRTFLLCVVALSSAFFVAGNTWQLSDIKVTTLTGVAAISATEVYGAMGDNSLGPGLIHSTNACKTSDYIGPVGGMNLDVAFTPSGTVGAIATVSGVLLTQDGTTFKKVPDLVGVSQNVEAFGSSSLAATGDFFLKSTGKQANGVAVSTDNGASWNIFDIGLNSSTYVARYGAFPTATTWYVSSGSWPYDASEKVENLSHKLSSRVRLNIEGERTTAQFKDAKAKSSSVTGYPGAISKTTDGGATWTKVYDSNGSMYFNEIHCYDTENCLAVAENEGKSFRFVVFIYEVYTQRAVLL